MNEQKVSGKYIRQNFSTILPTDTIDLLKTTAVLQNKKIYELLDEIIVEHLSKGNFGYGSQRKSAK